MLSFYYDVIDKYISRDDFNIVEMDTDSLYMAISADTIEEVERASHACAACALLQATARVRRACIHSYIHIWVSCHVTMYTMLMLLRGSDVHVYIHIWVSCILT